MVLILSPRGAPERETYRLLNLTESESDDDFARLEAGMENNGRTEVPDLNLKPPQDKTRIKRKIRLKRYESSL